MRLGKKKLIWLVPALALLLASCVPTPSAVPDTPPEDTGPAPVGPEVSAPQTPEGYSRADSVFSLIYDDGASMNPLKGTSVYNTQLFGLLYESLFVLSPTLEPVPVLCESFSTEDGRVYHITILQGVKFHDGDELSAGDVVYTLKLAKNTSKYARRLSDVESVAATGPYSLDIRLKRTNYLFPALLDVPIVKNGQADEETPVGTGPYIMGSGLLAAFTSHRDYTDASLRTIYLKEIPSSLLAEAFSERTVDLIDYDPTGAETLNIHMVHESRFYDTSELLFLAFNCASKAGSDVLTRRALMRLVDREAIASEIYASGATRPTELILNPALGLWDQALAGSYACSRQDFYRLATMAGLEDYDLDGYMDLMGAPLSLKLIVNSESPRKVEAARRIASDMQGVGINVTVEALTWSSYIKALGNGDFDMYLGEVRLRADLDMTVLFSGDLNYAKLRDSQYGVLMDGYLAATEEERAQAARDLNVYVAEDAVIVPILYKQRAVLTHVGVVSGMSPGQSGPFTGILAWDVTLRRDS